MYVCGKYVKNMSNSRRDFIKISTLGAAGLAVSATYLHSSIPSFSIGQNKNADGTDLIRTPTYCEVCFWKCAGWVHKDVNGNIQKIIGNDDDTNCNGRLCPRGTGGVGMYYDEDRLKTPLLRVTGEDGKQTYKEVSWDEAFTFIAERLDRIKKSTDRSVPLCLHMVQAGTIGEHCLKLLALQILQRHRMRNAAARARLLLLPPLAKDWIRRNLPISAIPVAWF
jgi:thiosulfate reductase / polysulfide reductase chain A